MIIPIKKLLKAAHTHHLSGLLSLYLRTPKDVTTPRRTKQAVLPLVSDLESSESAAVLLSSRPQYSGLLRSLQPVLTVAKELLTENISSPRDLPVDSGTYLTLEYIWFYSKIVNHWSFAVYYTFYIYYAFSFTEQDHFCKSGQILQSKSNILLTWNTYDLFRFSKDFNAMKAIVS